MTPLPLTVAMSRPLPPMILGDKTVVKPLPLGRQLEDRIIDFRTWERTGRDGRAGIALLERTMQDLPDFVISVAHASSCLSGSRGMFSPRAKQGWADAHRYRDNVIAFPVDEDATA